MACVETIVGLTEPTYITQFYFQFTNIVTVNLLHWNVSMFRKSLSRNCRFNYGFIHNMSWGTVNVYYFPILAKLSLNSCLMWVVILCKFSGRRCYSQMIARVKIAVWFCNCYFAAVLVSLPGSLAVNYVAYGLFKSLVCRDTLHNGTRLSHILVVAIIHSPTRASCAKITFYSIDAALGAFQTSSEPSPRSYMSSRNYDTSKKMAYRRIWNTPQTYSIIL